MTMNRPEVFFIISFLTSLAFIFIATVMIDQRWLGIKGLSGPKESIKRSQKISESPMSQIALAAICSFFAAATFYTLAKLIFDRFDKTIVAALFTVYILKLVFDLTLAIYDKSGHLLSLYINNCKLFLSLFFILFMPFYDLILSVSLLFLLVLSADYILIHIKFLNHLSLHKVSVPLIMFNTATLIYFHYCLKTKVPIEVGLHFVYFITLTSIILTILTFALNRMDFLVSTSKRSNLILIVSMIIYFSGLVS